MTINMNTTSTSIFQNVAELLSNSIKNAATAIQSSSIPYYASKVAETVATQVNQVWAHLLPLVSALTAFAQKDIGIATFALLGSATSASVATSTESKLLTGALFVGSLGLAVIGGAYLNRAGIIPNLFTVITA